MQKSSEALPALLLQATEKKEGGGTVEAPRVERPKERMVERRGFQKVPEWTGKPESFVDFRFRLRGFLGTEGHFLPLLDWVERHALDDGSRGKITSMVQAMEMKEGASERDAWGGWQTRAFSMHGGEDSEDEDVQGSGRKAKFADGVRPCRLPGERTPVESWTDDRIQWYGENLFQCLQSLLQGQHMTDLLRNLEGLQPVAARGFEAWFRLNRDVKGATGPRLIQLASRIFYPTRAKAGAMGAALEAWEADIRDFEQSGQRLGPILSSRTSV